MESSGDRFRCDVSHAGVDHGIECLAPVDLRSHESARKLDGLPLANGMAANDPRMNRAKPVLVDVRMQEAPRFVERKRKHIFRPKCFHRDPPTTEAWVIAEG